MSNFFRYLELSDLRNGDANTSFCHACIKSRSIRNKILALRVRDSWDEGVSDIRQ